MVIGLHVLAYQCKEFFKNFFAPWIEYKEKHGNLVISTGHCVFKEFAELGYPVNSTDGSAEMFHNAWDCNRIDYHRFFTQPLIEATARTEVLKPLLKKDIDYLWLSAPDEQYTLEEIEKTVNYIEKNQFIQWFRIHFKNLTFSENTYTRGFQPPRIFKNDKNYQLLHFFADDEPIYKDKTGNHVSYLKLPSLTVPESICFPKHNSWVSNQRSKDKQNYQKFRWGQNGCSFDWDDKENKLVFSKEYHQKHNILFPELFNIE